MNHRIWVRRLGGLHRRGGSQGHTGVCPGQRMSNSSPEGGGGAQVLALTGTGRGVRRGVTLGGGTGGRVGAGA